MSFNKVLGLSYFMLLTVAGLSIGPVVLNLLEPVPYTDVTPHKMKWYEGDKLELQYSFNKNGDCELTRFSPIGVDALPKYLDYTDNDGLDVDFDRDAGTQSLDIVVDTQGFDIVELRTVHQCGDTKVDRVFARVIRP